jgi:hypothetical protein
MGKSVPKNATPVIDGKKVCTICKENKPTSEFYRFHHLSTGYSSHCKSCAREYDRIRRQNKKEDFIF